MVSWDTLSIVRQIEFKLSALVSTWKDLGSNYPLKFMFDDVTVTSDEKGLYLVAYRSTGSLYFTLSITQVNSDQVELCVTPYRYSKPVFDEMLVVQSDNENYIEFLVSRLNEKWVDVLCKIEPSVFSHSFWSTQFEHYLTTLISDYHKNYVRYSIENRTIEDVKQEFIYMFSRLLYLHGKCSRSSRWEDTETNTSETDNSEFIISKGSLSFEIEFEEDDSYSFKIRLLPEHKRETYDFELSTDFGYLVKFTGYDLDFKLASYLASKVPEERQLQFLSELEECLVSLNLWSDYYIPMEYIYR